MAVGLVLYNSPDFPCFWFFLVFVVVVFVVVVVVFYAEGGGSRLLLERVLENIELLKFQNNEYTT